MPSSLQSMRPLVRTFSILRDHPELVLPVLAADVLDFVAMHLQHALHEPLFQLLLVHHQSVLGSTPERFVLTPENALAAAVVAAPLLLTCYFLIAFFYGSALFAIATILRSIRNDELIPVREAIGIAIRERGRVFRFTVSLWALAVVWATAGYAAVPVITQLPIVAKHMGFDLGIFLGLGLEIPCAYLIAGPVLRLLRRPGTGSDDGVKVPVFFAGVLFIFAQAAFLMLLRHALPRSLFQQTTVPGFLTQQAITGLLGALLYVPLFVAWSLIADPANNEAAELATG